MLGQGLVRAWVPLTVLHCVPMWRFRLCHQAGAAGTAGTAPAQPCVPGMHLGWEGSAPTGPKSPEAVHRNITQHWPDPTQLCARDLRQGRGCREKGETQHGTSPAGPWYPQLTAAFLPHPPPLPWVPLCSHTLLQVMWVQLVQLLPDPAIQGIQGKRAWKLQVIQASLGWCHAMFPTSLCTPSSTQSPWHESGPDCVPVSLVSCCRKQGWLTQPVTALQTP